MNLVRPAPFTGAENNCLLYALDLGSSTHSLFDSLIGFGVDPVIAFYEKIFVKLEPYIIAIHHQYEILVVLRS